MSLIPFNICRLAAVFGASFLLLAAPLAQAATNDTRSTPATSAPVRPPAVKVPAPPTLVPLPPHARSPIGFFRDLLAMDAAGREQALTNRSPEARTLILAKVREYESLKPDERELRLRVTELRWYLRPLMYGPATNRPAQLAMIPETYRELVEDRLTEWDKLSPEMQTELLANEATLRYLSEIEGRTDEQRRQALEAIPPGGRTALEQGIDKWSSMSDDQRQRMLNHFREFFELTLQEQKKVLNTLPGPDRGQIERTMRAFDNLPPDQRDQCIRSLQKYASLSPAERQQFLKNAERWKLMSPSDRQVWRVLVRKLPPPLPPPLPHLRASSRPSPPVPPVATNRN
jgi:Protein of unknown function (DUF3106)